MKNNPADIRSDLVQAMRKAFPGGVVDGPVELEASYFRKVQPELSEGFAEFDGASLHYERFADGEEVSALVAPDTEWQDDDNPAEAAKPLSASYHVFMVVPDLPDCSYECEADSPSQPPDGDEAEEAAEEEAATEEGQGWVGCCVAVSLVAPLTLVEFRRFEVFEDGGYTVPDIDPEVMADGSMPGDAEEELQKFFSPAALEALQSLREQIISVLDASGIEVLPETEADKVVPWLRPGEGAVIGSAPKNRTVTVRDAFFFRMVRR